MGFKVNKKCSFRCSGIISLRKMPVQKKAPVKSQAQVEADSKLYSEERKAHGIIFEKHVKLQEVMCVNNINMYTTANIPAHLKSLLVAECRGSSCDTCAKSLVESTAHLLFTCPDCQHAEHCSETCLSAHKCLFPFMSLMVALLARNNRTLKRLVTTCKVPCNEWPEKDLELFFNPHKMNAKETIACCPLSFACASLNTQAVEILLQAGASPFGSAQFSPLVIVGGMINDVKTTDTFLASPHLAVLERARAINVTLFACIAQGNLDMFKHLAPKCPEAIDADLLWAAYMKRDCEIMDYMIENFFIKNFPAGFFASVFIRMRQDIQTDVPVMDSLLKLAALNYPLPAMGEMMLHHDQKAAFLTYFLGACNQFATAWKDSSREELQGIFKGKRNKGVADHILEF